MAKLIFRYGAMGSSKTANALMVRYNYYERDKKVVLLKPRCEDRDGAKVIKSRIGLEEPCEFAEDFLENYSGEHYNCIIVDEVQFLAPEIIDRLSDLVDTYGNTVICYGLRTDFQSHLFPAAQRLMELADDIEQIRTICWCGKRAHFNARLLNGEMVIEGKQVQLGGNESYISLCRKHYKERQIKPQI
jgi:thymidine kinase